MCRYIFFVPPFKRRTDLLAFTQPFSSDVIGLHSSKPEIDPILNTSHLTIVL